jgi:hypothetical protein
LIHLHWRIGRKLGRTLYAMLGDEPSDHDVLLGMVDDPLLAEYIVAVHNARLDELGSGNTTP